MIDIYSLSTNELVAKLRSGDISSVEVCNAYIDRINKYEKEVKAWAFLDKKNLLEKRSFFKKPPFEDNIDFGFDFGANLPPCWLPKLKIFQFLEVPRGL